MKKVPATSPELEEARRQLARGGAIVLFDENRPEEGGYLCASARRISPEMVNLMASRAGGLICLAVHEDRLRKLGIPLLVADSPFRQGHAFGASIEASRGVTTGISAADRAATIQVASSPDAEASDLVMPGHIFPIQVRSGGVLVRARRCRRGCVGPLPARRRKRLGCALRGARRGGRAGRRGDSARPRA
jgi:3,4-dihydroxy 2-butanone 4-phosphate synthase / GTP cyclohydrolase II